MAGPKKAITVDPLDFSDYPEDRAERRLRFIAEYVVTPRGHGAREPFKVREFQRDIVVGAFAPGGPANDRCGSAIAVSKQPSVP